MCCSVFLLLRSVVDYTVDCTELKNALLNSYSEDGFLCLPNDIVFPVAKPSGSTDNPARSKLLQRTFHAELKAILSYLKTEIDAKYYKGALFLGPSGIGKSWASMSVLIDELTEAKVTGRSIVYFDATASSAFVFSDRRCVQIKNLDSGPNDVSIPELDDETALLIYDASASSNAVLRRFPCKCYIFSSPNAGKFIKLMAREDLAPFVCPSWTKEELLKLLDCFNIKISSVAFENRFNQFGGAPRYVVSTHVSAARFQLRDGLVQWSKVKNFSAITSSSSINTEWPSNYIAAKYTTDKVELDP